MLNTYITRTYRLLQNPAPATGLYTTALVTDSINQARVRLAGEFECIRKIGTISTVNLQREYSFASINIGVAATTGIQAIINIRRINYVVGDGEKYVAPQPWEYFDQYFLNNPVPLGDSNNPGARWPRRWAQYGQGGAADAVGNASGSFYLDPIPDDVYTLRCDCQCYPVVLDDDTTVEAIPLPFTESVPFLAAWYVLLSAQNQARMADAERFFKYYRDYANSARRRANPAVLRPQYEMADDPAQQGKVGRS